MLTYPTPVCNLPRTQFAAAPDINNIRAIDGTTAKLGNWINIRKPNLVAINQRRCKYFGFPVSSSPFPEFPSFAIRFLRHKDHSGGMYFR